jgi:hypothetical protein
LFGKKTDLTLLTRTRVDPNNDRPGLAKTVPIGANIETSKYIEYRRICICQVDEDFNISKDCGGEIVHNYFIKRIKWVLPMLTPLDQKRQVKFSF